MEGESTLAIDEIWQDDMLGRKDEAKHLVRFLENKYQKETNTPFVLNLDSSWGHGKTFFITHLAEQLRLHNYPVVVFDAWKNDFSDEALLSFISAVCTALDNELNGAQAKKEVKKLRDFATSLFKPTLPVLLSALVKQLTGMSAKQIIDLSEDDTDDSEGEIVDDVEELSSKLSQLAASKAIELYTEKKNATEDFIKTIEKLVSVVDKGKSKKKQLPIFIFIDELDRCRPTFSIELLEGIKHLFSAPGVYFIVSTDTKQLCHSIKAVYGAEFDAGRYLKRFFDMEYQLETPQTLQLASYLFNNSSIKDKFFVPHRIKSTLTIEELFADICNSFLFGARDIEQIFEVIKTAAYLVEEEQDLHFIYLMLIAALQHKYPDHPIFYHQQVQKTAFNEFFIQEIQKGEFKEFPPKYSDVNQGKPVRINLRQLFNLYVEVSTSDLKNESFQKRMSSLTEDIAEKLFQENGFRFSGFRDDPPAYDQTLEKYIGLVQRAGKFQS